MIVKHVLVITYIADNLWINRNTSGFTSFVNDASDESRDIKFDHFRRLLCGQASREDVRLPLLGQEQLDYIRVGFDKKTLTSRAFINEIQLKVEIIRL